MKVLYVIEKMSGIGGMERIFADKINWLCRQTGIEVTMALVWKDNQPIIYSIDKRVHIEKLDVPYVSGGLTYPLALYRYNKLVERHKPDITVLSWIVGAFLGSFGHHYRKTIYESHLAATMMKHRWLLDMMQRRVNIIVTLTTHDAKNFQHAADVKVIPNFTQINTTQSPSYGTKHCVTLGRLVDQKNFLRMLTIWKRIIERWPDWTLDIYGEGEERHSLEQYIHHEHLEEKVILHGATQEISKAYTSGSIYLMTSKMEGFPLTLIEAMTCGLPIVSFECPYGPQEIIKNEVTGYLISYHNDEAFINTLSHLMSDETLRRQMGTAAREYATQYSCETIMQRWMTLFHELLQ